MVLHQITVKHDGISLRVEFDTDDGFEVFKFQVFSLTMISPENQTFLDSSNSPVESEVDFFTRLSSDNHTCTIMLIESVEKSVEESASLCTLAEMEKADEALAKLLQAEEEAIFLAQKSGLDGRQEFAARLEGFISQVLKYEDPVCQEKARAMVQLEELEEKAVVVLAKEGKIDPKQNEVEHQMLFQLLMWFKNFFRWVNTAPCVYCGAETVSVGMGTPNSEDLRYGANRVELHRCKTCQNISRFPRYNDPLKLLETRSGRCGEWANCFTLYCRAFGYDARLVVDFTDHVWTECFSSHLGRWIHLDPCEGAFDKPLLYEEGWGKKLNYVMAFSKDGVCDVTRRYTRNWKEVRLRRNIISEENAAAVLSSMSSRLRTHVSNDYMVQLRARDEKEAKELGMCHQDHNESLVLPGRLTGTEEWRKTRGEFGSSSSSFGSESNARPKRACVDNHVSKVFRGLGELSSFCESHPSTNALNDMLETLLTIFKQLKEVPYRMRKKRVALQSCASIVLNAFDTNMMQQLFHALALNLSCNLDTKEIYISSSDPIDTALTLPVIMENLNTMVEAIKKASQNDVVLNRLAFLAKNERLCGAWTQASGEESPLGIATSAFDGLQNTKWEEPNGAKGSWLTYYLPSNSGAEVVVYELMAANDSPERDPKNWILEGSNDSGSTWSELDSRNSEIFTQRYERRTFEITKERRSVCNAFRLQFLAVRDSLSQSRLQLSCVDFFTNK